MKITQLIKSDHDAVEDLFEEYRDSEMDPAEREEIIRRIIRDLKMHGTLEEELFYGALKRARHPENKDLVKKAEAEHDAINKLLKKIADLEADSEECDDLMQELMENMEEHIEMEESTLFNEAKKNLSVKILEDSGQKWRERKEELESRPAGRKA